MVEALCEYDRGGVTQGIAAGNARRILARAPLLTPGTVGWLGHALACLQRPQEAAACLALGAAISPPERWITDPGTRRLVRTLLETSAP